MRNENDEMEFESIYTRFELGGYINRRIKTSDSTNLDTFSVWVAGTTEEVILIYSKYS